MRHAPCTMRSALCERMDISFVILTWNSEKYISRCLNALIDDLDQSGLSHEIFIVDNGSTDGTVAILKSYQSRYPEQIFPIFLEENRGTTFSRNLALKKAQGKYISVIDSDVEVLHAGTIKNLIETLESDTKIGLIAPKLLYADGRLQKSTDKFPTIFSKISRYFFLKIIEKNENNQKSSPEIRAVDCAISAMWVLKKEVLEKVGYFDEKIFYAPEDVDYCLRVWLSGYKVLYNPLVAVVHDTQEISRQFKMSGMTMSHIKGLIYYFRKHKYIFKRPNIGKNNKC